MVVDEPSPSKIRGEYAESEPETRAITEFVRKEQFDMLLAFHSQGREIYYDFDGMTGENSVEIAKKWRMKADMRCVFRQVRRHTAVVRIGL